MYRSLILLSSSVGALAAAPYSTWMADSVIARGEASATGVSYETGVIQKSFEVSRIADFSHSELYSRHFQMVYNKTSTAKYLNYITTQTNKMVSSSGVVSGFDLTYYSLVGLSSMSLLCFLINISEIGPDPSRRSFDIRL
jgi:hypothetical protein